MFLFFPQLSAFLLFLCLRGNLSMLLPFPSNRFLLLPTWGTEVGKAFSVILVHLQSLWPQVSGVGFLCGPDCPTG